MSALTKYDLMSALADLANRPPFERPPCAVWFGHGGRLSGKCSGRAVGRYIGLGEPPLWACDLHWQQAIAP